jgi:hypothetical protein
VNRSLLRSNHDSPSVSRIGQVVSVGYDYGTTVVSLITMLGDWGYINTDGLGLDEYMQWAEDLDAVRAHHGFDDYT